jgi:hypothetical protein
VRHGAKYLPELGDKVSDHRGEQRWTWVDPDGLYRQVTTGVWPGRQAMIVP